MRPKKYNFGRILMNAVGTDKSRVPVLSIGKNGQMIISKIAVQQFGLGSAFIDFVWDQEKRAFGFKKLDRLPDNMWTKTMRVLNADPKTNVVKVSVGRIMNALGVEKASYTSLPIEKYQDIMEHREIYFVVIPRLDKKDEDTNDR